MSAFPLTPSPAIDRIVDANLDRAREGLRVLEDWFRFACEDRDRAALCKDMRQRLAHWHGDRFRLARDTPNDPGTQISHPAEVKRTDVGHLLQANCSRVQEALRVVEEYAKLVSPAMAADCEQMRYQTYALENAILNAQLRQRLDRATLYLITSPVPNWLNAIEAALQGGVRLVQYRRKSADYSVMRQEALALKQVCDRYGALTIVNDRVDLALDIGADGVHLGQTDMPVESARQLLGPYRLIGQSTTNEQELDRALASSADYVGVGPVYATPTKAGKAAAGLDYVRLAASRATIPWYAIGGIDLTTLPAVVQAGAMRVSVVRSLMEADDPKGDAERMLQQLSPSADVSPAPAG